tara:strand:- start:304 stop:510 length:207 start_codon:yes stop_codon:yes gene_type:complete
MPGKMMMKKPMYGKGKKTKMKGMNYSMGRAVEMGKRPGMMAGKKTKMGTNEVMMEQDKVRILYGGGKT